MIQYLPHILIIAIVGYLFYSNNSMREEVTVLREQVKVAENIVEDVQKQAEALSKKLNTLNTQNDNAEKILHKRLNSDDDIEEIGRSIELITK